MATEIAEMKPPEMVELENELKELKNEYQKLEKHLTQIELKYQTEISQIITSGENPFLSKLQHTISRLYNERLYSDITIKLDDQEIFAHKIILTARSETWGVVGFKHCTELDFTGRRCSVARAMIKWVYTNQFDEINIESMIDLLKMANQLDIELLKLRCEKELMSLTTLSTSQQLLEISELYSCTELNQVCLQFINGTQSIKNQEGDTKPSFEIDEDTPEDSLEDSLIMDDMSSDEDAKKPTKTRNRKNSIKLKTTRIKSKIKKMNSKKPVKSRRKTVDFSTPTKPRFQTSTLQCKDCHRKFTYKDSYDKHVKMHKGDNCVAEIKADVIRKLNQEKSFEGFSNLEDGVTNSISNLRSVFSNESDQVKGSTDENAKLESFSCPLCPKSFPTPEKLKRHSEIHTRVRKYKCPEDGCEKSFFTNSTLKQHMLIHSNEKPYTCEVCQKPFRHSSALSVHLELHARQGQVEKTTFPCEECGLKLATTQSLQRHILNKHTEGNVKPIFQCSICGEIFGYRGSLRAHTKKHNGEGFTQCDICGREFKDRKNLKSHLRTHSDLKPYECPHCSYTCKHSSAMLNHVRRHTGVRPHICDVCGKSFISASEMKRHTLIHTGDKPFSCHLCGKAFRKSHHVKQHFKTHKNEGYSDPGVYSHPGVYSQPSNNPQSSSFLPNTLSLPNLG